MTRYHWTPVTVTCYGKTLHREVLAIGCRWSGALKGQPVQVILSRPVGAPDGYELALVTTDLAATPAMIIERYADRWSAETMFLDARHLAGVGQARTRTRRSVERLVPFGLCCYSLAISWYAHHGQPAADLAARRARAPWYRTKHAVSVADMLTALRRACWPPNIRTVTPTGTPSTYSKTPCSASSTPPHNPETRVRYQRRYSPVGFSGMGM
jgi:hypothetical protein